MRITRRRASIVAATALAVVAALTGCLPSPFAPPAPTSTQGPGPSTTTQAPVDAETADYLTAAASGGVEGSESGDAVAAGQAGVISVTDTAIAVNGGSVEIDVSADAPFSSILVGAGPTSPSGVPTPWPGSFTVDLASPASDASVVVTVSQAPPSTEFSVVIAVVDASGAVSAIDWTNVSIVEVGTGDVQVSVSFSEDSDVDLYVVDPEGDTIYYGAQSSPSGGELDLDSNPSCNIDGIRNENVTWPLGEAPSGSYEVRLNLYADCGIDQTSWVVTVQAIGRTYRWEGVLEAPGTPGSEDAGQVVARFDVP